MIAPKGAESLDPARRPEAAAEVAARRVQAALRSRLRTAATRAGDLALAPRGTAGARIGRVSMGRQLRVAGAVALQRLAGRPVNGTAVAFDGRVAPRRRRRADRVAAGDVASARPDRGRPGGAAGGEALLVGVLGRAVSPRGRRGRPRDARATAAGPASTVRVPAGRTASGPRRARRPARANDGQPLRPGRAGPRRSCTVPRCRHSSPVRCLALAWAAIPAACAPAHTA